MTDETICVLLEVVIMLNEQNYATENTLSDKLRNWQGPALYIYNDATFSERDFLNLSRVGQGSKLDRLETTGRFGLGFNAVYHFTDLPSFVSNQSLVFFDPHATNIRDIYHLNHEVFSLYFLSRCKYSTARNSN